MLSRYREKVGRSHPDTLVCANNVGVYLRKLGRADEAHTVLAEAFAGLSAALGASHLLTLGAATNVANVLANLGRREEAEALYTDTSNRLREILGAAAVATPDDHPDVLACEGSRAVNRHEMNEGDPGAVVERDRVLAIYVEIRSDIHPHSLALAQWKRIDRELDAIPW